MKPGFYKSIDDFIYEVNHGYEIEIEYKGRRYGICPRHASPEYCIYEWDNAETTQKNYKNVNDMLDDYEIQGEKLKDIILKAEILFH